jgi:predicted DNA-binding protein (MmcQ/YjbR family)
MGKRDKMKAPPSLQPMLQYLRELALDYPQTREDHPWGHAAFKVKDKVFLFLGADDDGLGLSVKLPHSRSKALALPFCEPTPYGLGKHGWVSATFPPDQIPPFEMLAEWIDESFRAIAPKKVVALLPHPDDIAIPGVRVIIGPPKRKPRTKAKKTARKVRTAKQR